MNVPHVIAKANSLIHGEVLKQLGARVVYPERDMAVRLGKGLIYNSFLDSVTLEGGCGGQTDTGHRPFDRSHRP